MKAQTAIINLIIFLVLLVVLESFVSIFGIFFGNLFMKFNVSILICLFVIIKFDIRLAPYFIIVSQAVHSLYSFDSWATETLSGLLLLFVYKLIENMFQLSSLLHLLIYSLATTLIWTFFSSILLSLKASNFALVGYTFANSFHSIFATILIFPIVYFFLNLVWIESVGEELN